MTNQHVDNGYKSVFTLVISGGSDDLVDELLYQLDGTPETQRLWTKVHRLASERLKVVLA